MKEQIGLLLPRDNGNLLDALADALGPELWCRRNPLKLSPSEALLDGWHNFCHVVKHQRRYFFLTNNGDAGEKSTGKSAADILAFLESAPDAFGLITTHRQGTRLYRARVERAGENLSTARQLGPPPADIAVSSNRMSPAGIVMMYASDDWRTAVAEIPPAKKDERIIVGVFRANRDFRVIDFTRLPPRPSFFDSSISDDDRYKLLFLYDFVAELSKPLYRTGGEHVDYAPTQVVTEWVRSILNVDGIYYPSARRSEGTSIVLFADSANVVRPEAELRLYAKDVVLVDLLRRLDSPFWAEVFWETEDGELMLDDIVRDLRAEEWLELVEVFAYQDGALAKDEVNSLDSICRLPHSGG